MRHCLPKTVLLSYIGHKFRIPRSTLSSLTQCCNTHFSALFIIFDKLQDFHRSHTSYDSSTANECELYCPPPPFRTVSISTSLSSIYSRNKERTKQKHLWPHPFIARVLCNGHNIFMVRIIFAQTTTFTSFPSSWVLVAHCPYQPAVSRRSWPPLTTAIYLKLPAITLSNP